MPNIRIDEELNEYLREHSHGESYNNTLKRMLGIGKLRGQTVRKQVARARLAPAEIYTWAILRAFRAKTEQSRADLQERVDTSLKTWEVLENYPEDAADMKHGQPRWKARFGTALAHLKKYEMVESIGNYRYNYQGGSYHITQKGIEEALRYTRLDSLLRRKDYERLDTLIANRLERESDNIG